MKVILYIENSVDALIIELMITRNTDSAIIKHTTDIEILEQAVDTFQPNFVLMHADSLYDRDFERMQRLSHRIRLQLPECIIIIGHHSLAEKQYIDDIVKNFSHDYVMEEDANSMHRLVEIICPQTKPGE